MSKIVNKDFCYSVDYDYDTRYSCKESGCDYICRCGTIYNARIKSIDINAIVGEIYAAYFDNSLATKRDTAINSIVFGTDKEIDIYTIDRLSRHFRLWDIDSWDIEVKAGYYGDEIGEITIRDSIAIQLENNLNIAFSISELNGRIEFLLGLEYGYLLEDLEGCQYEIIEVNKDDIKFGNDGHYKKIKTQELNHYSDENYNGIRGIVMEIRRKAGNQWRVIDGYHRCYSTKKDKVRVLKAYK